MNVLEDLSRAVENGRKNRAEELTRQAMSEGFPPEVILSDALQAAMDTVGMRFAANQIYVPEMLVAARAMAACVEILQPFLETVVMESVGHAVLCTVEGDVHDLGKNLVKMHLKARGFEVDDLGVDCRPSEVVDYCKNHPECSIVGISALLTTTMPQMGEIIQALADAGLRDHVKVFVGGGPVTQAFADSIGADYYTADALECALVAAECILGCSSLRDVPCA